MNTRVIIMATGVWLFWVIVGGFNSACAEVQRVTAVSSPSVTGFRIDAEPRHAGALYAHIGGKDVRIADQAIAAWILDKGQKIAYSAADGAGGYENEGQSLRIYNVRGGMRRKVLSAYYMIEKVSELKTKRGKQALLVELRDGGLGASHLAVVHPRRGQVFLRKQVKLLERQGDVIVIGHYHEADWERMTDDNPIPPYKTERYDVDALLRRPAVIHKPVFP
jgi:hypothetical protein